ncbi:MAG: hypothetical protein HFH84_17990 [Lachnospiraceae bacterium]|nr:hypothetical protein [Lachnospiraceae bacterium]
MCWRKPGDRDEDYQSDTNSRAALVRNYEGTASRYWTILEGIQNYLGDSVRGMTSEGCHL